MSKQTSVQGLPYFFVGQEIARKRIANFMNSTYPLLTQNSRAETKSIWYSFDHIKALYEELDYLGASGLRIYLGAYLPSNTEDENAIVTEDAVKHAAVAGQISLLMVPTIPYTAANSESRHTDLIIEDLPDFEDRLMGLTLEEFLSTKPNNAGSPCPPACIEGDTKFP
jgi:hypothetical protein